MMKNLKVYEKWDEESEENLDLLRNYIENKEFRENFDKAFSDRQMEADIVREPLSDTEIIVECWPKTFNGAVPNKISYYIDEVAKILSSLFGVKEVTWRFEAGKGVSRIIFDLNEPINRNLVKFKNMIM
jgi:hypothetical protein